MRPTIWSFHMDSMSLRGFWHKLEDHLRLLPAVNGALSVFGI